MGQSRPRCARCCSYRRRRRRGPAAGRADVVEPRVRHADPRQRQVVEGKFDKVRGKDVLVITGRFGFKTLDVSDPDEPEAAGLVHPGRPRTAGGYWQNEDMELDTKRKLIIGALDPRHTDASGATRLPGRRRAARPRPGLQERVLRHLVREPGGHQADRRLRRPAVRPHVELHPGLQVHLDRRPGAAQRPALARPDPEPDRAGAVHVHRASSATAGRSGSPTSRTRSARGVRPAGRHLAQRRLHGLLARRRRGRARASPGSAAAAASAATPPRAGTATRTRTASARPRRSSRSSSPAAACARHGAGP